MITHRFHRADAVQVNNPTREYVPTTPATKWARTLAEMDAAGGIWHFNEDQTEVTLSLPEGWKFSASIARASGVRPMFNGSLTLAELREEEEQ